MEDSHRDLEQKALRNVRALVDKLQHDELAKKKRQRLQLLIFVPIVLIAVGVAIRASLQPSQAQQLQQRSCEFDAWNARAAAFEREARRMHPEESARAIQDRLLHERPALMAGAKTQCDPKSK